MPQDTVPPLSDAINFALDFQQGEGRDQESFNVLVKKYRGIKMDATTLRFPDRSEARWNQEDYVWEISEKK